MVCLGVWVGVVVVVVGGRENERKRLNKAARQKVLKTRAALAWSRCALHMRVKEAEGVALYCGCVACRYAALFVMRSGTAFQ